MLGQEYRFGKITLTGSLQWIVHASVNQNPAGFFILPSISAVASPGMGLWDRDESPPPVVSKTNFYIFLNLLRKLGGGGGLGCCHYKRLNCFLTLEILRYIKLADCMLIHKLDGCCNTTLTPFTHRIAW